MKNVLARSFNTPHKFLVNRRADHGYSAGRRSAKRGGRTGGGMDGFIVRGRKGHVDIRCTSFVRDISPVSGDGRSV